MKQQTVQVKTETGKSGTLNISWPGMKYIQTAMSRFEKKLCLCHLKYSKNYF